MSIDLHPDDRLEQRLRAACQAVIPHLTDDTDTGTTSDSDVVVGNPRAMPIVDRMPASTPTDRRARLVGVAAAVLLLAGGVAVWAISGGSPRRSTSDAPPTAPAATPPAVTTPVASTVLAETTGSSVPCFNTDCTPIDRLAVVPGAADFYAGPESLGIPVVHQEWLDQVGLTRCIQLTVDGTACERIEGIAAVALVTYPTTVTTTNTVAGSTSPPATIDIELGTTYTDITPPAYAEQWGNTGAEAAHPVPLTVRGHDGVRYESGEQQHVVWQEQPGLLLWVAVPTAMADQLLAIAEGVRPLPGPTTIPYLVVVPELGHPWDANDNGPDGLLYARVGGQLCVGIGWGDGHCSTLVAGPNPANSDLLIEGVAPVLATQVRITVADDEPVIVDTVASAGAPDGRFFRFAPPGGIGEVSATWLAADGTELGGTTSDTELGPTPTDVLVGG